MRKICTKCGDEKSLDDFGPDKRRKDGKQSHCRPCHAKSTRKWYSTPEGNAVKKETDKNYRDNNGDEISKRKRQRWLKLANLKNEHKNRPCMDCNKSFPPHCMEFDHTENKLYTISHMNTTISTILEEIGKCEVVCSNCHRIRTEKTRKPTTEKRLLEHREMVNAHKSKPCADCGQTFPSVAMDFDHVRGDKVFEISNMGHYPRWKVMEEMAKCDVVCSNCHRIRTQQRLKK